MSSRHFTGSSELVYFIFLNGGKDYVEKDNIIFTGSSIDCLCTIFLRQQRSPEYWRHG
jgi:hypothetical protein